MINVPKPKEKSEFEKLVDEEFEKIMPKRKLKRLVKNQGNNYKTKSIELIL